MTLILLSKVSPNPVQERVNFARGSCKGLKQEYNEMRMGGFSFKYN